MAACTPDGGGGPFIDLEFEKGAFDQGFWVVSVEDDEFGFIRQLVGFTPQEAGAHGVKGAQPDAFKVALHHVDHTVFHLARGLVGEGYGDDIVGRDVLALDEVGQTAGKHARFARPGSGQHQNLTVTRSDGLVLPGIERIEQGIGHGSISPVGCVEAHVVDAVNDGELRTAFRAMQQRRSVFERGGAGRAGEEGAFGSGVSICISLRLEEYAGRELPPVTGERRKANPAPQKGPVGSARLSRPHAQVTDGEHAWMVNPWRAVNHERMAAGGTSKNEGDETPPFTVKETIQFARPVPGRI